MTVVFEQTPDRLDKVQMSDVIEQMTIDKVQLSIVIEQMTIDKVQMSDVIE